ncbi:Uncharacterized protein BM_BM17931 [Brugia malayi]|uniref:Uncharacterized protein n=1 Tax=Brugia malayi TaxID=6279 RepID=A0A4E9ETA4_BRUMA|nr:Uncharacterized protein BM_BM17931 [Brugia malayi]VIO86783.1 Uncharacterized protein BM_BM17931 [Brugia malayi]
MSENAWLHSGGNDRLCGADWLCALIELRLSVQANPPPTNFLSYMPRKHISLQVFHFILSVIDCHHLNHVKYVSYYVQSCKRNKNDCSTA